MRRALIGIGVVALAATALTAVPPVAAQVQPAAVTPAPNPRIDETCGLDATLILDASGSIRSAGAVNTVRNAGRDLMNALKDTNSTMRITQFATFSGELSARVPVNAATTGSGGALSNALANYYTPPPPRPAGVNVYNDNRLSNNSLTNTNWEDGIKGIDRPELAIFMTDGDPNAYNVDATRTNINTPANGLALDHAVTQANILKAAKTRMLVVGVGNGLTNSASQTRLKQISGPILVNSPSALVGKSINDVDAVAFTDFAALGAFLRSVVTSLCGNSVTIQKLAQSSVGADYEPATGWDVTVQPTVNGGFTWVDPKGPDNSAQTRATAGAQGTAAFQWKPKVASQKATVRVSEAVKSDFTADRWTCEIKRDDGTATTVSGSLSNSDPSFQFEMNPSDVAGCKLYNDFDYQPQIAITKVAKDDPVRGNGVGWDEEYTFTVTNTGNAALTVNTPVDPKCSSISAPSGSGAASGKLLPGASWTYTCQAKIGPVATVTTELDHLNSVSVTGIDPAGTPVSAQAQASVVVRTPRIDLAKSAKRADDGTPIPDDSTIPAGTKVTYVYTVTNTGNDTLNLVRASAVTDDKCSPVTYKSGDLNNNQQLETTETWLYECTRPLDPPSTVSSVTNTAKVTSTWSNPQNRQQNNAPVTAKAQMTINVKRIANLRIIKVTNPGEVDQDFPFTVSGQGVPAADESFDLNTSSDPITPPASRNILLDGPSGSGSPYTVRETLPDHWALTDVTCDATTWDFTAGVLTVTLKPEDNVTCTFTNQRLPSLTITKQTSPNGSSATFHFEATRPGPLPAPIPATFQLADGESLVYRELPPGRITVTEKQLPAGWELDDIVCSGADVVDIDPVQGIATLDLAYGDEADCVYSNGELPPATLTVVKDDVPATWDPEFEFTASGIGLVTPDQKGDDSFELKLGKSKTFSVRPLAAGNDYTVTETAQPTQPGHSGFALTDIECIVNGDTANPIPGTIGTGEVTVNLVPGDSAVCTYVNQQKPRLTIVKNAVDPDGTEDPDNPTSFSFAPSGALGTTGFGLTNNQEKPFTDITAGDTLGVTEAATAGWTLTSLECTGPGADDLDTDATTGVVDGTLPYGADVVCTYVNTKQPQEAYLFVLKGTDPPGDPTEFTFNATDGTTQFDEDFDLAGGDYQGFTVTPAAGGTQYTVSEKGKAGWRLAELDCVTSSNPSHIIGGNTQTGVVKVTLAAKEVGVCVFENEKLGTLSIDKVTDVASTTQFPFTVSSTPDPLSPASFSLTGGGTPRVYSDIPANTAVTLIEQVPTAAPDRWTLTDISCDGTVNPQYDLDEGEATFTIEAGEDVDCTYTDEQVPPATVQIVKKATPADGTEFSFTAAGAKGGVRPADQSFTLTPDGDIAVKTMTVYPAAGGEEFTFAEPTVPTDWQLTGIECVDSGDGIASAPPASKNVKVTIDPGDTITCTFTDVKDATLTVVKEAPDDPAQDFDFTWTVGKDFTLTDQQSRSATGLSAGEYTVQEINLPKDWYLDGPNGEHPTCTGTEVAVDYGPELGAKVTLAPGEEAVCSFANFFDYNPQITLTKEPDRTVVLEGKPVVYTYEVTNTGNVDVYPVDDIIDALTDDRCTGVQYVSGTSPLTPGASWKYSCTVASMTPAEATNLATATVKDPLDPQKTLTATDQQTVEVRVPELSLVKTVDKPLVYPATQVTYTYLARNLGATPFKGPQDRNAWINDPKCPPVYASGDTGDDKIMGIGEVWTYTCSTAISVDTTNTGTFTGTPFIPASPQSGPEQVGSPMSRNDTADVKVIEKGIDITKTPSAPGGVMKQGVLLVPVGSEVTYTYQVTSGQATVPMEVLDVTDDKCAPVEYESGDDNQNGLVDPGETWIYTCRSEFTAVAVVTNTVVVDAVEPQLGGLATDNDKAVVSSYRGSIAITKTPSAEVVVKGTAVTYTYEVLNNGTVDLTDVTVTDDKCAPVTYTSGDDGDGVMKSGDVWKYECVSSLHDDTTNVAVATGTTPSGGKVRNSTSVRVFVIGGELTPQIAVTKTPSATSVRRGDKVTYTYNVTNTGTMPLTNIRVSDDKCAPVTYVGGDDNGDGLLTSLASGESWPDETWVYTCTTAIPRKTTNTVTAVGSPWWAGQVIGADVSATAQATVRITQKPPLPIEVDPVKKCKGDTCTVVKTAKTNKYGKLDYRVRCRPVGSAASGEVSYCRTKVTKKGAVKVEVFGYRKVKVTVWIVAKPKPKYADQWRANTWKRTWIIRP